MADEFDPYSTGVEYQVTKVDPTNPETKGAVYQVHKVDEVTAAMSGKFYRARIIKDPSDPTVKGKVYQIVIIDDPDDPSVKGKVFNAIVTGDQEVVVVGPAVPPLDLSDAVADSLTYVKAFGETKLSAIPPEYTQVDGAIKQGNYSTDGKFDTVVKITTDDVKIEVIVKAGNMEQQSGQNTMGSFYACQARASSGATITGISGSTNGNTILGTVGSAVVTSQLNGQDRERIPGHIYLIRHEYKNGTQTLYVKDLTDNNEDTQTGTYTFIAPTSNFYIFGNSATTNRVNSGNTIYSCKIWDAGTLVFNAVSVKRDSDNAVGLYDSIRDRFIEPIGTFNAGAVTTPTPSDPMDIYCNNGKISVLDHTSWNVITNPTSQPGQGMFISSDGKLQKANDRGAGVFVPVTVGKKYTVLINKKTTALGNIIRYGQSNNGDLPNSAEQLLDWYRGSIIDGMMISFTAKRPYFVMQLAAALVEVGGIDEAVEVIESAGDNETIAIRTRNLNNDATNVDGYYIAADGTITAGESHCYSALIPVVAGETYVWSGVCAGTQYNWKRVHAYVDDVWNQQITAEQITGGTPFTITFTVPAGCNGIRISHFKNDTDTQVELGPTKTDYIEYNNSTATVNNLFAVSTYKDEQEILTGLTNHQLGILVLNGLETYNIPYSFYIHTDSCDAYITLDNAQSVQMQNSIGSCTHLKLTNKDIWSSTGYPNTFVFNNKQLHLNFAHDVIGTNSSSTIEDALTAIKGYIAAQYAAGTPVIVVYPLATEYAEPAPIAQTMNVVAGDNTLDIVQAGLPDLLVEAEYTKGD